MLWNAQPGRSMLLLVPHGCDETATSRQVAAWTEANFRLPLRQANLRPLLIRVTSDSCSSSKHFTKALQRQIERMLNISVETDNDDFASDLLQVAIEAAISAGAYPILVVERFHAFAAIRDGEMTSVLARMRSLEHEAQLTTLAIAPAGYDAIRESMSSEQPFLNSVYGDNHDRAIMDPLECEDFVAAAASRGIKADVARRLYHTGGGPDIFYSAMLDIGNPNLSVLTDECSARIGPAIEQFLKRSFPKMDRAILARLALGQLNKAEEAFLIGNPLWRFIATRSKSGRLECSSPVLARLLLRGNETKWQTYERCLTAFAANDFHSASDLALSLDDNDARLRAFRGLVTLRAATSPQLGRGLLGIDWPQASRTAKELQLLPEDVTAPVLDWVRQIGDWAELVHRTARGSNGRYQADAMARSASDAGVRRALLFMVALLVSHSRAVAEPAARISQLMNVPETILQALAVGFCDIDFTAPPAVAPEADYQAYFGARAAFEFPPAERKMTLASLLVIVPALLVRRVPMVPQPFSDPTAMRPLQQKLVDRVRNPAAHTIVAFADGDAAFLQTLCSDWVDAWAALEGFSSAMSVPGIENAPDADMLSDILLGSSYLISQAPPPH